MSLFLLFAKVLLLFSLTLLILFNPGHPLEAATPPRATPPRVTALQSPKSCVSQLAKALKKSVRDSGEPIPPSDLISNDLLRLLSRGLPELAVFVKVEIPNQEQFAIGIEQLLSARSLIRVPSHLIAQNQTASTRVYHFVALGSYPVIRLMMNSDYISKAISRVVRIGVASDAPQDRRLRLRPLDEVRVEARFLYFGDNLAFNVERWPSLESIRLDDEAAEVLLDLPKLKLELDKTSPPYLLSMESSESTERRQVDRFALFGGATFESFIAPFGNELSLSEINHINWPDHVDRNNWRSVMSDLSQTSLSHKIALIYFPSSPDPLVLTHIDFFLHQVGLTEEMRQTVSSVSLDGSRTLLRTIFGETAIKPSLPSFLPLPGRRAPEVSATVSSESIGPQDDPAIPWAATSWTEVPWSNLDYAFPRLDESVLEKWAPIFMDADQGGAKILRRYSVGLRRNNGVEQHMISVLDKLGAPPLSTRILRNHLLREIGLFSTDGQFSSTKKGPTYRVMEAFYATAFILRQAVIHRGETPSYSLDPATPQAYLFTLDGTLAFYFDYLRLSR